MPHTSQDIEGTGYPLALRVFGVLCAIGGAGFVALFVTQIVRAILLGQTGAVAPDYSQYSTATLIIYIVLMVICAFVTPDASPVTMLLLFAAMISLYEVSLALAKLVLRKKIARQQEMEAREAGELPEDA